MNASHDGQRAHWAESAVRAGIAMSERREALRVQAPVLRLRRRQRLLDLGAPRAGVVTGSRGLCSEEAEQALAAARRVQTDRLPSELVRTRPVLTTQLHLDLPEHGVDPVLVLVVGL